MPVEIVTIVNSSGKIISNGKHLLSAFKEAKAAYDEKKAAVKAERAVRRGIFSTPSAPVYDSEKFHYEYVDDSVSQASSRRSRSSKHSRGSKHRSASQNRPSLTMGNLKTHSEVSSVAPSRPPISYRSPYAENSQELVLSRPNLARSPTMPEHATEFMAPLSTGNAVVHRSRSNPDLQGAVIKKEIDMDLAYGSLPPDLEEREDLEPEPKLAPEEENAARTLVDKIEDLLTEAECVHHTATHIIEHLQAKPEAAAAVALTLAELSAIIGKMSPSFLAVLKGGSPAIFALLASPQFLIAAGLTVGVTVVMFGGWKIIKRIREGQEAAPVANAQPMAFEAYPSAMPALTQEPVELPSYPESEASEGIDEALVVEEELSTIESWRRGITPFGEDQTADLELISPEANRAIRSQYGGDDTRSERSFRTTKSHKSSKSHKSHRPRTHDDVPERKSSRLHHADNADDAVSEAGSHRSHKSHKSHRSHKTEATERTGLSRTYTSTSTSSKRSTKTEVRTIDDGSRDKDNTIDAVLRPKKDNMLKSLFKKKKKDDEEVLKRSTSSVKVR